MSNFVRVEHYRENAAQFLNVNWCLTNICNFKCTYCPSDLHNGTQPGLKSDRIKQEISNIANHYSDKKIFFEFTGGEVTYYKNFLEVAEHVKSLGCDLGIISNGKREISYWEKLGPNLDHVCLSYHTENNYPERFLEVLDFLHQSTTIHVNVMMNPELFDHGMELAKQVAKRKGVSIALQPLYKGMVGEMYDYTKDQKDILDAQMLSLMSREELDTHFDGKNLKIYRGDMKFIDDQGNYEVLNTPDILVRGLNNFKGWDCNAGLENVVIDFYGNVRRAWCNDPNIRIGSLNSEFEYPTEPIKCSITNCHCGFDIMCTKSKI